jgi:signal transduction histidine kinase
MAHGNGARALEISELERRFQFERLVLGVSTQFINLQPLEIDSGIERALQQIGEFCDVDRAYVFAFVGANMRNTHEWCAAGVEPQIQNLQELPCELFPWWVERIQHREVIHIPSVRDLPDEAAAERSILLEQEIVSIVVVPMVFGGKSVGFIGFDAIRTGKLWLPEDITLLRIAGEIVVNALERKRAELERRQLEEQLVQARSLDNVARLAGGIAHDFNNHLSVILNHARALEREVTEPRLAEYARVLSQSADQAAELTRQLMIVGRRDLPKAERFDVNLVLESLAHLLRRTLGEAVAFELATASEPCWVEMGKAHLKQIVVNLIMNARDAMPEGGQVRVTTALACAVHCQLELGAGPAPEGGYVQLRVVDDGVGMSAEVAQRALEPFFSTKGAAGTGLGLSTVHGIARQARGALRIQSAPGAGTTVDVYLPRAQAPHIVSEVIRTDGTPVRGQGELILLVEDSEPLRALLERALTNHGYQVLSAAHAQQALALLGERGRAPELLLTDVMLPQMSGRALAEQLLPQCNGMRVAYITGYDDEELVRQGVLERDILVLVKPFLDTELLRFVHSALQRA